MGRATCADCCPPARAPWPRPEPLPGAASLPDRAPCPRLPADGFTPLMIASCSGGGLETGNSEEEEDAPAVISDFIYQGASLHNQTDRTGETALHLAARYSRSDAAKRLLEASADANIQDNMGRTPLHAAVSADAQGVFQVGATATHAHAPCPSPAGLPFCSGPAPRFTWTLSPEPRQSLSKAHWCLYPKPLLWGGHQTPHVLGERHSWRWSSRRPEGPARAGPPHPDPTRSRPSLPAMARGIAYGSVKWV